MSLRTSKGTHKRSVPGDSDNGSTAGASQGVPAAHQPAKKPKTIASTPSSGSRPAKANPGDTDFGIIARVKLPEGPVPKTVGPRGTIYDYTLDFLASLAGKNNTSEWVRINKNPYDAAKDNFLEFASVVLEQLKRVDPTIDADMDAKACVFRMNRDTRFSASKQPYKEFMSMSVKRGGRKSAYAGYYVQIQPGGKSMIGAGIYEPSSSCLARLRTQISDNSGPLGESLDGEAVALHFGQSGRPFLVDYVAAMSNQTLKTAPRGVPLHHPDIDLLRLKSLLVGRTYTDQEILAVGAVERISSALAALTPFVQTLNAMMD